MKVNQYKRVEIIEKHNIKQESRIKDGQGIAVVVKKWTSYMSVIWYEQ